MDIEQLADACGGLAWVSERMCEIQGRLAADFEVGPPRTYTRLRSILARASRHHGQHAQWWRDALPDYPALEAPSRIRPPSDSWARLLDYAEESDSLDAVVALHGFAMPELIALLDATVADLSPVSDGPVIRTARAVSADLADQHREAKQVIGTVPGMLFQSMARSSETAHDVWTGSRTP